MKSFLSHINISKPSEGKAKRCKEDLTKKDLCNSLKSKCPCNDGLTKEFYKTFSNELKEIFLYSVSKAKEMGHFSTSQRQAIIKLIYKTNREKRFIENWRPISL